MRSAKIRGTEYTIYEDGTVHTPKGEKLSPWIENNSGYTLFRIRKDKKPLCLRLHRVMAESFIPNPENHPYVKHKNDDKSINLLHNLEWGTSSSNAQEGYDNGCYASKKRSHSVQTTCHSTGEKRIFKSIRNLADELNLHRKNISAVLKGKKNNTYPYDFEYVV